MQVRRGSFGQEYRVRLSHRWYALELVVALVASLLPSLILVEQMLA